MQSDARTKTEMQIAGRKIGPDHPPYVISEISCNHHGDLETAKKTITAAVAAGADAVKIQCYTADSICADTEFVIPDGPWAGRRLYELYSDAHTPPSMVGDMFEFARSNGITLF